MKLSGRQALSFFQAPDPAMPAVLISGADPMRVSDRRKALVARLIGPEGEAEMRLTRIAAADLRKDGALLDDAMRAQGFFPGPRVVTVEDATDGLAPALRQALDDRAEGDAKIVATAGPLPAKSALRKLFESHRQALSITLYDDPPGTEEIADALGRAGLTEIRADAREALDALARTLDPGDFRQTVEKLSLYKLGDPEPVTTADVEACQPASFEAAIDDLIGAVADGEAPLVPGLMRRLAAQGVGAVQICLLAGRHFRRLHAAASDPGGAASGVGRLRPPAFGPRRDALVRQAGAWGRERLEEALTLIFDTELALRSTTRAPLDALLERRLVRLAMMGRSRR